MKKYLLLILVLFLAAVLRFWGLGENPPALSWDEAAWGYNAYSLGIDGRDEFGRFLPLDYLESFGDFKPPFYAYLSILPIKLFGLNEFSTRFASAFFGVLTVGLTYFLAKEIFAKPSTPGVSLPLIASFLLAISPWHLMLSRAAFEANVASFFLIAGVFCFLKAIREKGYFLVLAAAAWALSFYTFNTSRVVAPLLALGMAIAFFRELLKKKKWLLFSLLAGGIIMLPLLPFLMTPQARLRFQEVNIFTDTSVVLRANQEMENDSSAGQVPLWSRILHNRRWGYFQEFVRHYLDHFNPAFLFIRGDGNPKFSIQDVGQFYLWELPFLIGGALLLLRRKPTYGWIIPFWLLVGIIPAATARETPHALRIETTLPVWQLLVALGVAEFWQRLQKREWLIWLASCLLALNIIYFFHNYWFHYPIEYSREWQYGYKEVTAYLQEVDDQYDQILMTAALGRPYIYFLFYFQKNPKEFRQEAIVEREVAGFVKVNAFGKYYFFQKPDFQTGENILYLDTPKRVPAQANIIQTFNLLNKETVLKAFEL